MDSDLESTLSKAREIQIKQESTEDKKSSKEQY